MRSHWQPHKVCLQFYLLRAVKNRLDGRLGHTITHRSNDDRVRVSVHGTIVSHQADTFCKRLGNHDAVKWIAVMVRQIAYSQPVIRSDRQFEVACIYQHFA